MDMEPSEQEQRQHLREAEAEIFATNNRTLSGGEAYGPSRGKLFHSTHKTS